MNAFKHSGQSFFKHIEKHFLHHKKYLLATAINLTALFIVSIALQIFGIFEVKRFINLELFVWIVIVLDIIALRLHQHTTKSAIVKDIFKYVFLILFIIQFIKGHLTIELLSTFDTELFVLTIIFGIITFYDNRHTINKIEKENEQELMEEQKRKKKFAQNFPKLNKIPIFRNFVKWLYKEGWLYSICFLLIILIATGLRLYGISDYNLRGDEFQVVSAANGYLNTGMFYKWDWINNKPSTETYNRAWPHTLLIAKSYGLFGVSEWSSRIVSAVFGVLLIIFSYFITKGLFKDKKLALLFILALTFFPSFITYSRFTRMYALFIPIYFISAYFLFKGLTGNNSINFKNRFINSFIKKYLDFNYVYLLLGFVFLYISHMLHINTLIIFPSLFLFVLILSLKERKPKYIISTILGLWGLAFTAVLYFILNIDIVHSHFIAILSKPQTVYWKHLFSYPFFQSFGTLLFILTIILVFISYSHKNELSYLILITIVTGTFFVYFANTYSGFKYISNIVPISILVMFYSFHFIVRIFKLKVVKLFIICILLFSILSQFNSSINYLYGESTSYGHFSDAYQTIVDNYDPETEVIIGQYLRTYYLRNLKENATIVGMSSNKRYTYEQFQNDLRAYESGWITWETTKGYHIRKDIKNYIAKNFQKYHGNGVDDTIVEVYYFNKSMIRDIIS